MRGGRGGQVLGTGLPCFCVAHRVDGPRRWLLSGHADGSVRLSDVIAGRTLYTYPTRHEGQVSPGAALMTDVTFSAHEVPGRPADAWHAPAATMEARGRVWARARAPWHEQRGRRRGCARRPRRCASQPPAALERCAANAHETAAVGQLLNGQL